MEQFNEAAFTFNGTIACITQRYVTIKPEVFIKIKTFFNPRYQVS